jgi:hypothetical protein
MLDLMAQIYRINLSPEFTELYFSTLGNLSAEQIQEGFKKHVSGENCQFPPKPGDIIAASGYRYEPEDALERERRKEAERSSRVQR